MSVKKKLIRWTTDLFVERANEMHGGKYEYPGEYINSYTPILIKCPVHDIFEQIPRLHLSGKGCPLCFLDSRKLTNQQFLDRANAMHDGKYKYTVPYQKLDVKIDILCSKHGAFSQTPRNHLQGTGCPLCCTEWSRLTNEEFLRRANVVHEGKYVYPEKYQLANIKIKIECPIHGIFEQAPLHHLNNHGCPRCSKTRSKAENAWLDFLNIPDCLRGNKIKIDNRTFKPDALNVETLTIYEFYGDFWHGNPRRFDPNDINFAVKKTYGELYRLTMDREESLKQAGYNIVSIWESDWKKINEQACLQKNITASR